MLKARDIGEQHSEPAAIKIIWLRAQARYYCWRARFGPRGCLLPTTVLWFCETEIEFARGSASILTFWMAVAWGLDSEVWDRESVWAHHLFWERGSSGCKSLTRCPLRGPFPRLLFPSNLNMILWSQITGTNWSFKGIWWSNGMSAWTKRGVNIKCHSEHIL